MNPSMSEERWVYLFLFLRIHSVGSRGDQMEFPLELRVHTLVVRGSMTSLSRVHIRCLLYKGIVTRLPIVRLKTRSVFWVTYLFLETVHPKSST